MENRFLLGAMVIMSCALSMNVNAQIEVQSSGNVKVSKPMAIGTNPDNYSGLYVYKLGPTTSTSSYGVKSYIKAPSSSALHTLYAVYGVADALNATQVQGSDPVVGVYGIAKKGSNILTAFSAGVAGITHTTGGIGVYGGIGSLLSTLPSTAKYAGYFNGLTYIHGNVMATSLSILCDENHIENVQSLSDRSETNNLALLRPISYTLRPDSTWIDDDTSKGLLDGTHYGLVAQDVQKIYPNLVNKIGDELSVNYIELIPLLIQEIKRLSAEVEDLKKQK